MLPETLISMRHIPLNGPLQFAQDLTPVVAVPGYRYQSKTDRGQSIGRANVVIGVGGRVLSLYHLDVIGAGDIEGTIPANADIGAGRADESVGLQQDSRFSAMGSGDGAISGGRPFALVGIEHGEALQKRNGRRLVAGFRGACASR